jgi:hypothetical protein
MLDRVKRYQMEAVQATAKRGAIGKQAFLKGPFQAEQPQKPFAFSPVY